MGNTSYSGMLEEDADLNLEGDAAEAEQIAESISESEIFTDESEEEFDDQI